MVGNVGVDLAAKFHSLFAGMSQVYGTYDLTRANIRDDGKREGYAQTKRAAVTEELWQRHLTGAAPAGIGIVPIRDDNTCVFGAIDIDVYAGINHAEIVNKLARSSIQLIVCRSKSGGAHLYCFASEPVAAARMQSKLKEVASLLGYGNCEIFPKQTAILVSEGDAGQWINMPYYNGVKGMRFAIDSDGNALSPSAFLDRAEMSKMGPDWFEKPILLIDDLPDGPPCLQALSHLGYPPGTRNDGLYNIGVYLKKSSPDDWEHQLDVMNHKYMSPPLGMTEVQGVAKSLKRKDYNYTCTKSPICNHCNATLCRTRKFGVGGGQGKFPSLGGLTKLDTKPPIWFWTVDGVRMEMTTSEMQDPRSFQRKCMDILNLMPTLPSAPLWQAAVQHAMDSVTIVEAPEDASPEGQFWEMVERFCTGRAQATSMEDIVTRKPFTEGGRTYFRLSDLCSFLTQNKFVEFRTVKVSSILKDHGAKHHASNFKGRTVNYWSIPSFTAQTKPFDIPDSVKDGDNPF